MKKINIYILLSALILTSLIGGMYLIFSPNTEQEEDTLDTPSQITDVTIEEEEDEKSLTFKPVITVDGNLTKTILHTLNAGEELVYNEYYAILSGNNQNFAALVKNYHDRCFLIFNGQPIDAGYAPWIGYLVVEETDGYCFLFQMDDGSYYLNLFGRELGPYNKIRKLEDIWDNMQKMPTEREFAYWYAYQNEDEGEWWISSGENSKIVGPFEDANVFTLPYRKEQFGYAYLKEGYWYEVVNGKTYGPYEDGSPHNNRGKIDGDNYIFQYGRHGNIMVNHNNTKAGPYNQLQNIYLTPHHDYGYGYYTKEEGKRFYLHINGNDYGPYRSSVDIVQFPGPGKFMYQAYGDNEQYFIINGETHGPYGWTYSGKHTYHMSSNGNYIYTYRTQKEYTNYLNINGEVIPTGQKEIVCVTIQDSGEYAYSYKESKSPFDKNPPYYIVIGDSIWGPYTDSPSYQSLFIAGDKYMFGYKQDDEYYINLNGDIQGPYQDLGLYSWSSYLETDGSYKYGFYADKDRKFYICENGDVSLYSYWYRDFFPFDKQPIGKFQEQGDKVEIFSPDKKHYIEAHWDENYVIVNGKSYGECTPINITYNPDNHSFVWIGIESRDEYEYGYEPPSLVKYELLLDK